MFLLIQAWLGLEIQLQSWSQLFCGFQTTLQSWYIVETHYESRNKEKLIEQRSIKYLPEEAPQRLFAMWRFSRAALILKSYLLPLKPITANQCDTELIFKISLALFCYDFPRMVNIAEFCRSCYFPNNLPNNFFTIIQCHFYFH